MEWTWVDYVCVKVQLPQFCTKFIQIPCWAGEQGRVTCRSKCCDSNFIFRTQKLLQLQIQRTEICFFFSRMIGVSPDQWCMSDLSLVTSLLVQRGPSILFLRRWLQRFQQKIHCSQHTRRTLFQYDMSFGWQHKVYETDPRESIKSTVVNLTDWVLTWSFLSTFFYGWRTNMQVHAMFDIDMQYSL